MTETSNQNIEIETETETEDEQQKPEDVVEIEGDEGEEAKEETNEGETFDYSFEGMPPAPHEEEAVRDSSVIRTLRQQNRELNKRLREVERPPALTSEENFDIPMPTLAECGGDEAFFQQEMADWASQNAAAEVRKRDALKNHEREIENFRKKAQNYTNRKKTLAIPGFEAAEEIVGETLSVPQVAAILNAVDDPAPLIYALGKNPKALSTLAEKTDMVQFALHLGKLSAQLKRIPRRPATAPEKTIRGNAALRAGDPERKRLREEADRTNDDTALLEYEAKRRAKT